MIEVTKLSIHYRELLALIEITQEHIYHTRDLPADTLLAQMRDALKDAASTLTKIEKLTGRLSPKDREELAYLAGEMKEIIKDCRDTQKKQRNL